MKISEFRKLIREEITKVINEADLIKKSEKKAGVSADIKVNDHVRWFRKENERGMSMVTGMYIGKVVKILGSKHMHVEVESPSEDAGDLYKVTKDECLRIPAVGEVISAKLSTNSGAGSGSQGSNRIVGTVTKVDIEGFKLKLKQENNKSIDVRISALSDVVITK